MTSLHVPTNPVRLVTASALFDGHDASINIMRRIFQSQGAEVIHLGHNRSVKEVVDAAIEEDVQGVAVSSYQGGHVEYFEYLVESLRAQGAGHVQVVGGGGGVIVPEEIARLRESGVTIFSPEDGQRLGLVGMINSVVKTCDVDLTSVLPSESNTAEKSEVDDTVERSYEFVREARAALKVLNRGEVDKQGNRVENVRSSLEDVLQGLGSQ